MVWSWAEIEPLVLRFVRAGVTASPSAIAYLCLAAYPTKYDEVASGVLEDLLVLDLIRGGGRRC